MKANLSRAIVSQSLVSWGEAGPQSGLSETSKCHPGDTVEWDETDRTERRLREHLATNVRACGDMILVRILPPAYHEWGWLSGKVWSPTTGIAPTRQAGWVQAPGVYSSMSTSHPSGTMLDIAAESARFESDEDTRTTTIVSIAAAFSGTRNAFIHDRERQIARDLVDRVYRPEAEMDDEAVDGLADTLSSLTLSHLPDQVRRLVAQAVDDWRSRPIAVFAHAPRR